MTTIRLRSLIAPRAEYESMRTRTYATVAPREAANGIRRNK
jgi:hypothetical protein